MRLSTGGRTKGILSILLSIFVTSTVSQFPGLYDALTGSKSIFRGIKNVIGGVLHMDEQHHGCVQKYVCCKFAKDGCEVDEEGEEEPNNDLEEGSGDYEDYEDRYDYVKRSWVRIPKRRKVQKRKLKVKKPGSWRWIGDAIAGGVSRVAKGIGFVPSSNRRQGYPPTLMNHAADIALHNWNKIPWHKMIHVMDFATDSTNIMRRDGHVYPYVKSAAIGYGYGHEKHDEHVPNGPCTDQIAVDCPDDGWEHLETHNNYNGGALSRNVEEKIRTKSLERAQQRRDGTITSRLERNKVVAESQWNSMHLKDFLSPKVFLCKAGRFFDHLHRNHFVEDPEYPEFIPEEFGTSDFHDTCNPSDFDPKEVIRSGSESEETENNVDTGNNYDYEDYGGTENEEVDSGPQPDTEVVEVRSLPAPHHRNEPELGSVDEMPLLIFEGLPEKSVDQTEEELVESILEKTVEMPNTSVIKAVRLPMTSQGGKSLVMVQMDSHEDELTVLEHKSDIRSARSLSLEHVGIRELNYKELWNRVQELTVVKRVVSSKSESTKNEESDAIITAREPKIIKEQWS